MAETSHLSGPGEDLPAKGSSGGPGGQPQPGQLREYSDKGERDRGC